MSRCLLKCTLNGGPPAASSHAKTGQWTLRDTYGFLAAFDQQLRRAASSLRESNGTCPRAEPRYTSGLASRHSLGFALSPCPRSVARRNGALQRRHFHNYFVTHLPSSSLHPDSRSSTGPHHKLPRSSSTPHTPGSGPSPAAPPPMVGQSRETTVVRIPLRSAKHHFGVSLSRGTRPYNEDTYQAGVVELPAFAKRSPTSLTRSSAGAQSREGTSAESASGDPQVFYFGVFDGHGGNECSDFLREELHTYIEDAAKQFGLQSSLKMANKGAGSDIPPPSDMKHCSKSGDSKLPRSGKESLDADKTMGKDVGIPAEALQLDGDKQSSVAKDNQIMPSATDPTVLQDFNKQKVEELQRSLVLRWKDLVGGYFRRFKPQYFSIGSGGQRLDHEDDKARQRQVKGTQQIHGDGVAIEAVMTYAFLKADLDFVAAQASKKDEDAVQAERPLNEGDILGQPNRSRGQIGGPKRFKGGSTCSVAMISTPSLTPFWHPASQSTLLTSHVGDTRILVCSTASGQAIPLTTNHHPSSPVEGDRLRRYAASFVTDSFGEERMSGLANTRAFGDMQSKRLGVSAEPEIRRLELGPAEYSFVVLVSDGVSGTLNDQEIVDIVKEARTPEQGAKDVVSFATEVSTEGDNSTCLVVRLGGWERRSEGGLGSMGTKESRDWRRQDATDPRSRRT